jgi:hypothetical protein
MLKKLRALLASLLIVCIAGLGLPAHAGMLPTDAVGAGFNADRDRVASFLDREDVQRQLHAQGVDPAAVKARVAAMTDEEAAQVAAHMDEMPAGGVLGLILVVFIVLLITDILGFTKVFPFTRTVR